METPQPKSSTFPKSDLLGLLALSLLFLFCQTRWTQILPPGEENLWGIQNSLKFWLLLQHNPWDLYRQFTLHTPPSAFTLFLPVTYLVGSLFYSILGFSPEITYLASLVFIIPLVFSLYGAGSLLGGRWLGWSAVLLALGNPRTLFWGKFFNLNFPEMALFSLIFYLLLLSRNFSRRTPAILLGITLGIGLLTKYVAVYLVFPLGWSLFTAIFDDYRNRRAWLPWLLGLVILGLGLAIGFNLSYRLETFQFFKTHYPLLQILGLAFSSLVIWGWNKIKTEGKTCNLALSLLTCLGIALPWYLGMINVLIPKTQIHLSLYPREPYLLNSLHYFLICLQYFFPLFPLLLLGGVIFTLSNWKNFNCQTMLLGSWGGLLLLSWIIIDPAYRYFLSLSVIFVLLGILGLNYLKPRIQAGLTVIFALWFLLNLGSLCLINSQSLATGNPLLKIAEKIIALSDYPQLPQSKKFPGFNLSNIVSLTPSKTVLNDLAREMAEHASRSPSTGLRLIFLNLAEAPGFTIGNWQLEIYLWKNQFLPSSRISFLGGSEFLSFEEFRRVPEGIKENQNIEFFPHWQAAGDWDYCLIAEPETHNFTNWEKQLENKGFKPSLLKIYPLHEKLWSRELNLYLRLYALKKR